MRARANDEAKSHADESSGPADSSLPHQQAVDMTAPETFTAASKQPLTTGRRPDMTGICALLRLEPYRRRKKSTSATFVTTEVVFFHPNGPPIDLAPRCARSPMLSSMLALDRQARATSLSHPSSQSTDRGGAGQPGFERDPHQGPHQACRTAAAIAQRVSARPQPRQAICQKGHL